MFRHCDSINESIDQTALFVNLTTMQQFRDEVTILLDKSDVKTAGSQFYFKIFRLVEVELGRDVTMFGQMAMTIELTCSNKFDSSQERFQCSTLIQLGRIFCYIERKQMFF